MAMDFLSKVRFLLQLDHPVSLNDIATLTRSSESDVLFALAALTQMGMNVQSDGLLAEIRRESDDDCI